MLGSIPGPQVSAHLVTSYFLFSSVTVAETILFPVLVTGGSEGLRQPLQGAAGEAGDAAAAGDGGTHKAPLLAG